MISVFQKKYVDISVKDDISIKNFPKTLAEFCISESVRWYKASIVKYRIGGTKRFLVGDPQYSFWDIWKKNKELVKSWGVSVHKEKPMPNTEGWVLPETGNQYIVVIEITDQNQHIIDEFFLYYFASKTLEVGVIKNRSVSIASYLYAAVNVTEKNSSKLQNAGFIYNSISRRWESSSDNAARAVYEYLTPIARFHLEHGKLISISTLVDVLVQMPPDSEAVRLRILLKRFREFTQIHAPLVSSPLVAELCFFTKQTGETPIDIQKLRTLISKTLEFIRSHDFKWPQNLVDNLSKEAEAIPEMPPKNI